VSYLSKVADFNLPEFRWDLWQHETRVLRLSRDVVCVIIRLSFLIQYRHLTDTHIHDS